MNIFANTSFVNGQYKSFDSMAVLAYVGIGFRHVFDPVSRVTLRAADIGLGINNNKSVYVDLNEAF